jgi:hypothetical protein
VLAYIAENADTHHSRDAQERRLAAKILLDFQRNGLALSEEKQAKVPFLFFLLFSLSRFLSLFLSFSLSRFLSFSLSAPLSRFLLLSLSLLHTPSLLSFSISLSFSLSLFLSFSFLSRLFANPK